MSKTLTRGFSENLKIIIGIFKMKKIKPYPWAGLPAPPPITPACVVEQLKSFPRGTAPGPSGLRAQHLLDALVPGDEAALSLSIRPEPDGGLACVRLCTCCSGACSCGYTCHCTLGTGRARASRRDRRSPPPPHEQVPMRSRQT